MDILEKSANISCIGDKYQFEYYINGKVVELDQDEDVLDTWFSSGLRPFSVM